MNLEVFKKELEKLNINVNDTQLKQLEDYYNLLIDWNNKINLTAITEKEQVYLKHFYDSLTITKIINLNEIDSLCDIGTGAGFPGMVIKILFPNINVILVDSLNKRIEFLKIVKERLKLNKLEIYHDRAEEFAHNNIEKFDVVTARAVANLSTLLEYSIPMVKINKYFIPLKSNVDEEIINSKNALEKLNSIIEEKIEFLLPIENSKRTILKIKKVGKTNNKYPRKYKEIKEKPL